MLLNNCCCLLLFYYKDQEDDWGLEPIYPGCNWSSMDVLLVLEMYKVIGHMGDGLENMILGLISSLLPKDNAIAEKLKSTSRSNYFFQQTIKCGHKKFKKLSVYEIQACRKGCCHFIGDNSLEEFCVTCDKENDSTANEVIYYFPLRDRIRRLLLSDLKRFFTYSAMYFQCICNVFAMYFQCIFNVFSMYFQCINLYLIGQTHCRTNKRK